MKPGYKHTEVGVIPEEWEVKALGEIAKFLSGGTPSRSKDAYWTGDIPWISATSLRCFYIHRSGSNVTKEAVDAGSKMAPIGSTLLLVRGSALHNEILSGLVTKPVCFNQDVKALVPNSQIAPKFLTFVMLGRASELLRLVSSAGNTAGVLDTKLLKAFGILLPPLPEQRAIATGLSDVDGLLGALDRLIAKKRDLKQAAMQQLLTGQTRLPGFKGKWETKRLGDIAHIKTGSRNNEDKVEDGQHPFFVRSEVVERINTYSHDCEAILVPGEGRIGDIFHYINGRFDVHQRVYAITRFSPDISGRFIHFYLSKNFGAWAMQNTVKATVDSLRLPTFQTFEMRLPPTKAEQTAIATVLTDMDLELAALEQRQAKTRALKQGMMQDLLTGRTRLV